MSSHSRILGNVGDADSELPRTTKNSKSILSDLHEKQERRVKCLYNPAEMNLRAINQRNTRSYHHPSQLNNHRGLNTKNKFNKILQVRERYREDKIRFNRERAHELQSYNDYLDQCELESQQVFHSTDLDQLIAEEQDLEAEASQQPELELSLEEIMEMLNISK